MENMVFRVVTNHDDAIAKKAVADIRSFGIEVFGVREADIVKDSDNSKVDETYILECRGSLFDYKRLKKHIEAEEIIYEGFKTLM